MANTYKVIMVIDNLPFSYCHGDSSDDEQGMTFPILPFIMSLRRKVVKSIVICQGRSKGNNPVTFSLAYN